MLCMLIMVVCCIGLKQSIKQKIIYIDPGHGGIDGGCVGIDGTFEKDLNLEISLELKDALINLGYIVEMTRIGDYDLATNESKNRKKDDIIKRCELMNKGDLFVSIHCNAYPDAKVFGAQVFYSDEEEKYLALSIQNKIKDMFNNTNREINKLTNKYILENVNKIGCIVEVGFLSNNNDLNLLKNKVYRKRMALAIALGINDFINNDFKKI